MYAIRRQQEEQTEVRRDNCRVSFLSSSYVLHTGLEYKIDVTRAILSKYQIPGPSGPKPSSASSSDRSISPSRAFSKSSSSSLWVPALKLDQLSK